MHSDNLNEVKEDDSEQFLVSIILTNCYNLIIYNRMFIFIGVGIGLFVSVIVGIVIGIPQDINDRINYNFQNSSFVKFECPKDDGFTNIQYGNLRIKFVYNENDEWYYDLDDSLKECEKLGAELWDVREGVAEWEKVINYVKINHTKELMYGIWINGNVTEDCNGPDAECEQKARDGKGVPITWPVNHTTPFSRLDKKVSTNACIMFSNKDDLLWKSVDCANSNFWAICVKRNCN